MTWILNHLNKISLWILREKKIRYWPYEIKIKKVFQTAGAIGDPSQQNWYKKNQVTWIYI